MPSERNSSLSLSLSGLPKAYDPKQVEPKWYPFWEERGYFHADSADESKRERFCIVIPPPNVTGSLHMGHALQHAIHDLIVRWQRMLGKNVLCLPGTDHAGIATQYKVEQELAEEGLTRHDLGRERMLERVWRWKEKYGGIILQQLKQLGCSYDWQRERFTMDEGYAKAVLTTFVKLYEQGLIYRGHRVINWCPRCLTALSDLEVEHEEEGEPGSLWFIRYPAKDGGGYITVATTRPETMLADTAVAVNPKDERYTAWAGRRVILPLMNREIPVITDDAVSPEFGTGAVKVTPAHDAADFEIAQRHDLPHVVAIDEQARMTDLTGKYAGLDRYECREAVLNDLQELGLLEKVEDYRVPLGRCYRCDTVIEPLLSEQWFVRMKELAQPAIEVIKQGKVRYVPERFARYSIHWLEGIKDWCISRQIWWGHRIPVWYCKNCGREQVGLEAPEKCAYCECECERERECESDWTEQDPDVLDTWFSSAIWPHATLGWPDDTPDLRVFYPTDLMITDRQILYLWVARMIMSGLRFAGDIPFHTVFVHPTVLTREGKRMSKSLGTGIDPLDLMEKYGADGLRFGLIFQCEKGQDIRFAEENLDMARTFANKVWNATRFVLMNLDEEFRVSGLGFRVASAQCTDDSDASSFIHRLSSLTITTFSLPDRWILSRLNQTIAQVNRYLCEYELDKAAKAIYNFVWDEYCDWCIEISKPSLRPEVDSHRRRLTQQILVHVLETSLRLLHPFMPFLTEELWQQLPHDGDSIMVAPYPQPDTSLLDIEAEQQMSKLIQLVRSIRNIKADLGVPTAKSDAIFITHQEAERKLIEQNMEHLTLLARLKSVSFLPSDAPRPSPSALASVDGIEIYVPLTGLLDLEKERSRLSRRIQEIERDLQRSQARLSNPDFVERAPTEVVKAERRRQAELQKQLERLQGQVKMLG